MNTITVKILVFVLSVFVLITVAHQFSLNLNEEYETETALLYSSADKVSFKGIYIRNETVINSDITGVLSYPVPDGSKIAKDSAVAYVYEDGNAIYINQQIQKLEDEISLLEAAQNPGTTDVAQLEFISELINEKYQTVTSLIAKGDFQSLRDERKNFQSLMGIYQIIINEETDYNDRINSLKKQLDSLRSGQKEPAGIITAGDSGYFISYTDGYEDVLSSAGLSEINADLIRRIIDDDNKRVLNKYTVGKMVDGYRWNMVGIVNTEEHNFSVSSEVKLKFYSSPDYADAVIEMILPADNPDESIIVLSCDELKFDFVQRRVERVEIILDDYEGIKIPREAIRFDRNNEKGVYILEGEKISFRKLDIIFESDGYLLSAATTEPGYVSIYDDIIVKGEISYEQLDSEAPDETNAEEITEDLIIPAGTSEVIHPEITGEGTAENIVYADDMFEQEQ